MVIGATKLFILISVQMTLTFIHDRSCMRNQKFGVSFSDIWLLNWMEVSVLPQSAGLLKFLLDLFCTIFKGELC